MFKKTLKIHVWTDSETLFNVIIRKASTKEKRLMIFVKDARGTYNDDIIDDIIWIRRKFNLTDDMTKAAIL